MFCCCRLLNENKKACPWPQSLYIDRLYKYIFEFIHVQNAYCSLYGEKKLVIIFHLFGTYSVHSGLLSLVWEKVEHRCGYLVIVFCKFKTEYKCPGLYIMITLNFFHTCFFTCFFFLGCFWSIFMTILTHNLFAEGQNSRLIFGLSFWHFVVDDFVIRCRRRSHADQESKQTNFLQIFKSKFKLK